MPYCKVHRIRLINDDPRAEGCGERDLQSIDNLLVKGSPMVCEYCTGFCECDQPIWKRFVVEIECYDEKFKAREIIRILGNCLGNECGEIDVEELL